MWADDTGTLHHVDQSEGGEQGDALMLLLFSLGQHAALQAVQRRLVEGEPLFAFLDDVYVTTPNPDRVGPIYRVLDAELYRHARIRINGGVKPKCGTREASAQNSAMSWRGLAQEVDPGARVWRGSELPAAQQSVTVLGTPPGKAEFVHAQLNQKLADHNTLLSRIPLVADVQSAWALYGPITFVASGQN